APARLDGDVLGAVDLIGDRSAGNSGVGLLLPQEIPGLRIEGAEHAVVRAADEDQVATGGQHGGEELPREVMMPHLFSGGRIPGLEFAVVIRSRTDGQTDILGICAEPELAGDERLLDAGKPTAETLLSRHVHQARLWAVGRRRPVLAAP